MNNNELREHLAQNGKVLTPKQRQAILEAAIAAQQGARDAYLATHPEGAKNALDSVLDNVPKAAKVIADIGDTVITVARALIIFSLPVLLALALYVEAERVRYGLLLFERHESLAALGAWLLVTANLVIELVIQYIHQREGYTEPRSFAPSLALFWRKAGYWLGWGSKQDDWQPAPLSPAHRWQSVLKYITAAILLLAVGGSMRDALEAQGGTWYEGMAAIATESTLLEIVTWLSGLVFAVVVVTVSQSLTAYVSQRAVEFGHELANRPSDNTRELAAQSTGQAAYEQAEREALLKIAGSMPHLEGELNPNDPTHDESDIGFRSRPFGRPVPDLALDARANGQMSKNGNGNGNGNGH